MIYKHELWDSMITILKYTVEKRKKTGPGVMQAEDQRVLSSAEKGFDLPLKQLEWVLTYICNDSGVLAMNELNSLDANEQEAARSSDLYANTTSEGEKSAKEAEKRLRKAAKMKPITDAKKKLGRANAAIEEKKIAADLAQVERDRPKRELSEAEQEAKKAVAELKKAELSVIK